MDHSRRKLRLTYKPEDGAETWSEDLFDEGLLHRLFFEFNVGDSIAAGRGMVFVGGVALPGGYAQLRAYEVR